MTKTVNELIESKFLNLVLFDVLCPFFMETNNEGSNKCHTFEICVMLGPLFSVIMSWGQILCHKILIAIGETC